MTNPPERKLILIRHSVPKIAPAVPASQWHLSEKGRLRCQELGRMLEAYDLVRVVASREPKAVETGQIVAGALEIPLEIADGLHEHDRSNIELEPGKEAFSPAETEAFRTRVTSVLEHPGKLVYGVETGNQAHERFSEAIAEILERRQRGNLAIVSHGTVMALFVSRAAGLDPVTFWLQLGLPAYVVLSLPGFGLLEIVDQVEISRHGANM